MKCPFELPVEKTSYKNILEHEWFCIRDANRFVIISQLTEEQADYIVQAINGYNKLVERLQKELRNGSDTNISKQIIFQALKESENPK
jgi:hypothetical protein